MVEHLEIVKGRPQACSCAPPVVLRSNLVQECDCCRSGSHSDGIGVSSVGMLRFPAIRGMGIPSAASGHAYALHGQQSPAMLAPFDSTVIYDSEKEKSYDALATLANRACFGAVCRTDGHNGRN